MAAAPVPPSVPAVVSSTPPLSQGARIIDTFIAPSKTFTDLRRSAAWWAPWLVIAVLSLISIYAIGKQITFEQITKNTISHSKRADQFDKLPAETQASQIATQSKVFAIIAYCNPIVLLLFALLATLPVWLTFKFVTGAETSFGQGFAITMYSWLPGAIGAILLTITLFAGVNPEGFDINNPVGVNLAYYLDQETTGKFIRGMASSLDILTIWSLILIGIGYSCTSKVKRSTAIMIVVGWFLVCKIIASGLATLG